MSYKPKGINNFIDKLIELFLEDEEILIVPEMKEIYLGIIQSKRKFSNLEIDELVIKTKEIEKQ